MNVDQAHGSTHCGPTSTLSTWPSERRLLFIMIFVGVHEPRSLKKAGEYFRQNFNPLLCATEGAFLAQNSLVRVRLAAELWRDWVCEKSLQLQTRLTSSLVLPSFFSFSPQCQFFLLPQTKVILEIKEFNQNEQKYDDQKQARQVSNRIGVLFIDYKNDSQTYSQFIGTLILWS